MIKPHYLVVNLPTDAAPQFIQKLTPFRQTDRWTARQTDRQTARKMTARNDGQTHRKIKVDGRREMRMNKLCYQLHTSLWLL